MPSEISNSKVGCALGLFVAALFSAWPALADEPKDFNIPPQQLETALLVFSQQSGAQVATSGHSIAGVKTSGVSGRLTPKIALSRLVGASDLEIRAEGEHSFALVARQAPSALQASDQAGQDVQSNKSKPRASVDGKSMKALPQSAAPQEERADERNDRLDNANEPTGQERRGFGALETVVVTAQKREERLIDVPLSLSVLGTEELQRRGLVGREDYMRSIPSVLLRDDGPGLAEIVIRGAYGDGFRTGPTVGLYFGDVPLTGYAIGGSSDIKLIDIARVEVLRGPQGTLHGSNALSGAVRYIPAAPDLQNFTGRLNLGYSHTGGYGGDNTVVEGVVNFPLVEDKLALRVVGFQHQNEGYVRNVAGDDAALQATAALFGAGRLAVNKDNVGSNEYSGGRVSALWQPTAAFSVNLTYLKQKDSQDDRLFELRGFGPYQLSDYQFGDVIGGNEDALKVDLDLLNLTAEYDFGWGALYSSTAWIDQQFVRKWGVGVLLGSPARPIPQISTTDAEVFAQEVRLTSELGGPFQFVVGLYYEDSEQPTSQPTFFGGDPATNPFRAVKLWDGALDRAVTQKAAFGELSYELTDSIEATVGGRYFDYDSQFSSRIFDSVVIPESTSDTEAGETGTTLKVGIDYKPREDALIYASWSQGFRLGRPLATELIRNLCDRDTDGFLDGTDISSFLNRVDSDQLDSYELGAKLGFMAGRATLNAAVYQNDWTDIPVAFTPPSCLTTTTINGGSARARGFESEGSFQLLDALRVHFGIGYVDSELTATTSLGNSGDRLNFTPEFNGSLGVEYGFSIAGQRAFVRGDYLYFGSYYTQTGERGLRADSYSLINLHAGMKVFQQSDLQFHVANLMNSDAFTSVIGPSGFPPGYAVRLRPRTIGVGLSYSF